MDLRFRIPAALLERVRADLARPHPFAAERVGFLTTALDRQGPAGALVLAVGYGPIEDAHYVRDPFVGARIGTPAIRSAMQLALDTGLGLYHVHAHLGRGVPGLSVTDLEGLPPLVRSFSAVSREQAHGIALLSDDEAAVWAWLPGSQEAVPADVVTSVGRPLTLSVAGGWSNEADLGRYNRQTFLGPYAQEKLETVRLGVVGVGGGGSHVVQQTLHLGFRNVVAFDVDIVEDTNLNRLVGATLADATRGTQKVAVGRRLADALLKQHAYVGHAGSWEEHADLLARCDIVIGCVDTFAARRDLEAACRRALVPYIDIGMDVHQVDPSEPPRMGGQVIVSMPGGPCMHCLGYLNDEKLAREAADYGDVGGRPQVVFANGVLASTAVGLAVDLATGWSGAQSTVFLSYDGNRSTLTPDPRLKYLADEACSHYPLPQAGPPRWTTVSATGR